jgi:hypothetical protein
MDRYTTAPLLPGGHRWLRDAQVKVTRALAEKEAMAALDAQGPREACGAQQSKVMPIQKSRIFLLRVHFLASCCYVQNQIEREATVATCWCGAGNAWPPGETLSPRAAGV